MICALSLTISQFGCPEEQISQYLVYFAVVHCIMSEQASRVLGACRWVTNTPWTEKHSSFYFQDPWVE